MDNKKSAIITFYSYKGGVGRSMALANVAWLLSHKYGKKVLVIDWDLEAPGLHRFFNVEQKLIKGGLIDLFDDYKTLLKEDIETLPTRLVNVEKYILSIPLSDSKAKGSLSIIAAGKQDNNYAGRVNKFNWDEFYDKWRGYGFIEYLRDELKRKAEIILVDSRTGVTDIGSICTLQLPDVVVLLFALNEQNISGIEFIAESIIEKSAKFSERPKPPLLILRPARVEKYLEQDKRSDWEKIAAERLKQYLPLKHQENPLKFMKENALPYIGAYSFGETPLAVDKNLYDEPAKSFDSFTNSLLKATDLLKEEELAQSYAPGNSFWFLYIRLLHKVSFWVRSNRKISALALLLLISTSLNYFYWSRNSQFEQRSMVKESQTKVLELELQKMELQRALDLQKMREIEKSRIESTSRSTSKNMSQKRDLSIKTSKLVSPEYKTQLTNSIDRQLNLPEVQILWPHNGALVSHDVRVEGTVKNLPKDMELWIIKEVNDGTYHPDRGPIVIQRNSWQASAYIGNSNLNADIGLRFKIHIVMVDHVTGVKLSHYIDKASKSGNWSGISFMDDWKILATVSVARK